jgi:hypothetical protein
MLLLRATWFSRIEWPPERDLIRGLRRFVEIRSLTLTETKQRIGKSRYLRHRGVLAWQTNRKIEAGENRPCRRLVAQFLEEGIEWSDRRRVAYFV